MSSPVVSVIMPVFNGGTLFRRAAKSILTQDLPDFELIIIDDASSDGSAEVAEAFATADSRVRVVRHRQNLGVAATLNEAVALARAPLVARMDADDESLPARLRLQVDYMETHHDVAVAGSFVFHMGARPRFDHLIELPTDSNAVRQTLKQYNCVYHGSVIFRKQVVRNAGCYRTDFANAEDYELWLRISRNHDVRNIPEALLRYRFTPDGATLGRKWQQLYYVYLAQAVNADGSVTFDQARERADKMLRETDRRYFLGEVAKGTVAELLRLRLWRDAAKVVVSFENELDPALFIQLARDVLHASLPPLPARASAEIA